MKFKLKKIRSDASFREFFRLHKGKKTSIIVTAKNTETGICFILSGSSILLHLE